MDDLRDIIRVRTIVECEALRLSMKNGDDDWESDIIASLHRLCWFVDRIKSFSEGANEFDRLHKAFHTSLISACGSPRLLELHRTLYDQGSRYLRAGMFAVLKKRATRANAAAEPLATLVRERQEVQVEHRQLADIALSCQFDAASERLTQHLSIPETVWADDSAVRANQN